MSTFLKDPYLPPLSQKQPTHTADEINEIIDDRIVSSRDGGYHKFLVRRKNYLILKHLD